MAETPTADKASRYQSKVEKVTHPPQIIGLLRRIRDSKVLLSVQVPGHEGVYNSLLLQVDPDKQVILLDELNPKTGHELVTQVGQVKVRCQCHGIELGFACPVEIGQGQSGISFYRAALPASISYLQRRRNYRVRVAFDKEVPVHLPLDESAMVDGQLFDLSVGGIGFSISSDARLKRGQILESCAIELPKGDPLQTQLEVRFVKTDDAHRVQRVGAAFINLTPQQEHAIRHFVTQLEREMLRRKAQR